MLFQVFGGGSYLLALQVDVENGDIDVVRFPFSKPKVHMVRIGQPFIMGQVIAGKLSSSQAGASQRHVFHICTELTCRSHTATSPFAASRCFWKAFRNLSGGRPHGGRHSAIAASMLSIVRQMKQDVREAHPHCIFPYQGLERHSQPPPPTRRSTVQNGHPANADCFRNRREHGRRAGPRR